MDDDVTCEHAECQAVRLIARRIANLLDNDPACRAAADVIRAENDGCSYAGVYAIVFSGMLERCMTVLADEAYERAAANVDDELKELLDGGPSSYS